MPELASADIEDTGIVNEIREVSFWWIVKDLGYGKGPAKKIDEEMRWRDVWRRTRMVATNAPVRLESVRHSTMRTQSRYRWENMPAYMKIDSHLKDTSSSALLRLNGLDGVEERVSLVTHNVDSDGELFLKQQCVNNVPLCAIQIAMSFLRVPCTHHQH
jgi:hypothetical protein